jgi:hypothetical protein
MDLGLPITVAAVAAIVAVFYKMGSEWASDPRRRSRRLLEGIRQERVAGLVDGLRFRVAGVARRSGREVTSPLTGRRCIGYRLVIEEPGDDVGLQLALVREDCAPFELVDEGAVASVEGPFLFGLEVDSSSNVPMDLPEELQSALEKAGRERSDGWGGVQKYRCREALLEDGDHITVLGRASLIVDPRGERDTSRAQPILRVIRGSSEEPTVLADAARPPARPRGR